MPALPQDPNTLDQGALFTCASDAPPASSPARIRRVNREEWTHSIGFSLGSSAANNPFYAPEGHYSTFSDGVSIDPATLDLYMLVLPVATHGWSGTWTHSPDLEPVIHDSMLRCMFQDAAPSDDCIDYYVDRLLTVGVLFRTPDDGERSRLRAFLVDTIAAEGGDVSLRPDTLSKVAAAAWMTSGALFRRELGEPVEGDPAGRSRLTNDELALALGGILSTHPTGAPLHVSSTGDPPGTGGMLGWMGLIRQAANDGTIQDPDVLRSLFEQYRGGVDESRADIAPDSDSRDIPSRGEYWLAPRIMSFFREYFDYESANSVFKDHPSATSAFVDEEPGPSRGYSNLQSGYYGYESTLVPELDDTIARAVIDAENGGDDVFHALLTTRLWRLPSNVADTNGVSCSSDADCTDPHGSCVRGLGVCGDSIAGNTAFTNRTYGLDTDVPATQDGRWVTMPEGDRAGVLTHPAWLSSHGSNFEDDASAVRRGYWIREHLYCQTVPPLSLVRVEAQLVPSDPTLRARDRIQQSFEESANGATCMECHRWMNPMGLSFERYNHAGFLRADDHGMPPDGSGTINLRPGDLTNDVDVADAVELANFFAGDPYARGCFVRHVFRYFMGRDETMADACTLTAMQDAFTDGSFFAMLEALLTSDTFLYRSVEGGAP